MHFGIALLGLAATQGDTGCDEGYMKNFDGICEDKNECLQDNICVDESAKCINTEGSYECHCKEGEYMKSNGYCRDINECRENTDRCGLNTRCSNTRDEYDENKGGSYNCVCDEGWEPEEDGLNCKDVDECSDGTHQCQIIDFGELETDSSDDVKCINLPGHSLEGEWRGYNCFCPDNYDILGTECHLTEIITTIIKPSPTNYETTSSSTSSPEVITEPKSTATSPVETTTSTESGEPETANMTIYIVAGAVGLVIILGIIGAICFCKQTNQKQVERSQQRTTFQRLSSNESERKKSEKVQMNNLAQAQSYDSFDSLDDDVQVTIPLSKFSHVPQNQVNQNNFPPPPPEM